MSDVRQINFAKLPSFWSGMSFVNKASYLCSTHQARDYNEAASMLSRCRSRKPARPSVAQYQASLDRQKLS